LQIHFSWKEGSGAKGLFKDNYVVFEDPIGQIERSEVIHSHAVSELG
jgi:hypothetical protein